jgi:hypothetical protein
MSQQIKVLVNWKYTNPRQYKERVYTFRNQERYDSWFTKMISDERLRKIIGIETIN